MDIGITTLNVFIKEQAVWPAPVQMRGRWWLASATNELAYPR